jgi:ABC-type sugar transport system substrate-binding protein
MEVMRAQGYLRDYYAQRATQRANHARRISGALQSKRFAFVGTDDVECGRDLCRAIAKELNNTGVVAVLAGNPNANNLQRRIVGLKEEAKNYPGLKILDTFYHKETPQDSVATVEQVMQAHPEVTAGLCSQVGPCSATTL